MGCSISGGDRLGGAREDPGAPSPRTCWAPIPLPSVISSLRAQRSNDEEEGRYGWQRDRRNLFQGPWPGLSICAVLEDKVGHGCWNKFSMTNRGDDRCFDMRPCSP